MPMKDRTREKLKFAVLLLALAVLLASPPDTRAQGTDAYFEAQDFGDGYAYGFSHEGFGNDYIYNLSHQAYGSDYIYGFSHQMFGDDYIYGFTHESFGDDYTGSFTHQGFNTPLGSGIFILLVAGTCYTVKKRKQKKSN